MTAVLQAPEQTGPHRLLDPLPSVRRRLRPGTILVWSLIAVVLTVQGWNIAGYPGLGDDEGTYLSQAWAVRTGYGLAPYTYWYDHPPGGWLQIALVSWLPDWIGGQPVTAYGRWIMLVVSAVNVALLYGLARRVGMARWSCALAVLLFGLSPLSVTMQRQIYLDSFAVAWFLGAFFLALSPRRHLWHHVAAGACAAVSVLSKETMAVALPALVVALWHGSHPSTRRFSLAGFLSSLVLVISFYPLYAMIKLEFLPAAEHVSLIGAIQFQLQSRTGSGTIFEAGSDASKLLNAWLYSDRILLMSGVVATVLALLFSGTRPLRRLRPIIVAAVLLVMVGVRPGGYLPAMYVLQILPFLALIIAALAEQAVKLITVPRLFSYRTETVLRWSLVAALGGATAWMVVPNWYAGNRHAMTTDDNQPYRAAASYIRHQIPDPAGKRIVVDNALWLDAVEAGFKPGTGAVWFYKLDKDADVSSVIRSYRDVDYVVSSPIMRQSAEELPTAKATLEHSQVLRTFGSGDNRVEIREIVR